MLGSWIIFIFGVLIGILVTVVLSFRLFSGVLKIDKTNPEKDVYRFDVKDIDIISTRKYIILKVDSKADLSQK